MMMIMGMVIGFPILDLSVLWAQSLGFLQINLVQRRPGLTRMTEWDTHSPIHDMFLKVQPTTQILYSLGIIKENMVYPKVLIGFSDLLLW